MSGLIERTRAWGRFTACCWDRFGTLRWREDFDNVVTTVGKNFALDTYLGGVAYTVTGPYLGLISSVGFSAVSAADTMSSHAGWTEAGLAQAPTYNPPRKTLAFGAASGGSKAFSTMAAFEINTGGTIEGAFLVFGPGALATIDDTNGVLYSAGLFSSPQTVGGTDIVNVGYTAGL